MVSKCLTQWATTTTKTWKHHGHAWIKKTHSLANHWHLAVSDKSLKIWSKTWSAMCYWLVHRLQFRCAWVSESFQAPDTVFLPLWCNRTQERLLPCDVRRLRSISPIVMQQDGTPVLLFFPVFMTSVTVTGAMVWEAHSSPNGAGPDECVTAQKCESSLSASSILTLISTLRHSYTAVTIAFCPTHPSPTKKKTNMKDYYTIIGLQTARIGPQV